MNYNAEYVTIAWLKCYEILEYYKLIDSTKNTSAIKYFGICEQPGAFVFAINHYVTQKLGKSFDFILQSLNSNIIKGSFKPEKNLYQKYKDRYDYGIDATGDVTNIENIKYYRKKYYNEHFNLITADCGQDCSDDFSQQEKNLMEVVIGQFLLAVSLCEKETNYIFKLFTMYEYQMKEIIYILSILFNKVAICRTISTKMASGEIYCVCQDFKYEKAEMDNILNELYIVYSKYYNDKSISMIKNNLIDEDFIKTIDKINKILLYRRLTNLNFLYFRINNADFTKKNSYIEKKINDIANHYVQYYISLYNINKLNDENKLVPTKFRSKYVQSRQLLDIKSKYHQLFIYKTDPIFNNGLYIYYLIGKNYRTNYEFIKSEIEPKYYKEKIYDTVDFALNLVLRKTRLVITHSMISHINLYRYYGHIRCIDKIVSFAKKYNNKLKYVETYNINLSDRESRDSQHKNKKLVAILEKYNDVKYNSYFIKDLNIDITYKNNTAYVIIYIDRLDTAYNGKSASNIFIELLLDMVQNIDNNSSIIIFFQYNLIIIFDIINFFSKYFEHVNIFKYKHYMGHCLYVLFNKKKEKYF